jgi:histidyl-tRNA synthetase
MTNIRTIRGMNDILPEAMGRWHQVQDQARAVLEAYGYREIRTPLLERTELFSRGIGEVTDIVEKEMYTFTDRSGDSLSLRPECTASVVRAAIQGGVLRSHAQRLWYMGPMFRHERPQKGRYRQFHQIGAEVFGLPGPQIDAELILMLARLWQTVGLNNVTLELNSLGTAPARQQHRAALQAYFRGHMDALDADSQRRLESNPLRILDSKNPDMQALIETAPRLDAYTDAQCRTHFDALQNILSNAGVSYSVNPRLVRGLDYYSRTVFEWTTDELGAQGTVCGGGRYDGLVEEIGGSPCPGVGFSIGLERLVELLEVQGAQYTAPTPHVIVLALGERAALAAHPFTERLRDRLPGTGIVVDAESGGAKAKFKRADRSGAQLAVVLGDSEVDSGEATLKYLRDDRPQQTLSADAIAQAIGVALA